VNNTFLCAFCGFCGSKLIQVKEKILLPTANRQQPTLLAAGTSCALLFTVIYEHNDK
jgi:hypothetical protein